MTTGWPQDQQGPRWPYADDDTGPAGSRRGRLATETDPRLADAPMFGADHPSGPLPVGPMLDPRQRGRQQPGRQQSDRQQRGRLGRKSRGDRDEFAPGPEGAGDADYDWIKYLGEAGPAQESRKRPAADSDAHHSAPAAPERPTSPRGFDEPAAGGSAGRRLPRRHAAPASPPPSPS